MRARARGGRAGQGCMRRAVGQSRHAQQKAGDDAPGLDGSRLGAKVRWDVCCTTPLSALCDSVRDSLCVIDVTGTWVCRADEARGTLVRVVSAR